VSPKQAILSLASDGVIESDNGLPGLLVKPVRWNLILAGHVQ